MYNFLKEIKKKVVNKTRLSFEDGCNLYNSNDIISIGKLANIVREEKNSNNAYFISNLHINPTNLCINKCKFCAFSKQHGDSNSYTMSVEEVIREAELRYRDNITEFHIVGGLHPDLPFDYYLEIINRLHSKFPCVHIQAFTAVEIAYFSKISGISVEEVLKLLKDAGLGSIPGGGAEIFSTRIREMLCPEKISGEEWLNISKTAHLLGIKSNATMLYGHIETIEERINHLIALRNLQDETGNFMAFIPLAFHPDNTNLSSISKSSGILDLKTIAISRLMLDNFPHIKAFWVMLGKKIAQISLSFGADDIDGTVIIEKITQAAGAEAGQEISKAELIRLIKETGRIPVERDTLYKKIND